MMFLHLIVIAALQVHLASELVLTPQDQRQAEICSELPAGMNSAACIELAVKKAKIMIAEDCDGGSFTPNTITTDCKALRSRLLQYEKTFCVDPRFSPNLDFCSRPALTPH